MNENNDSQPEVPDSSTAQTEVPAAEEHQQPFADVVVSSHRRRFSRKFILLLLIVLLLGGAAAAYLLTKDAAAPTTKKTVNATTTHYLSNQNNIFCASVGFHSIQCKDLASNMLVKYKVPVQFNDISYMTPSPDGKQYLVIDTSDDNQVTTPYIVDEQLKVVKKLPAIDISVNETYTWTADSKHLIHFKVTNPTDPKKVSISLAYIDTANWQTKPLSSTGLHSDDYILGGDGTYIYLKSFNHPTDTNDTKPDKILALKLSDSTLSTVDTTEAFTSSTGKQLISTGTVMQYDNVSGLVYFLPLNVQDSQKGTIVVAKIEPTNSGLKLQRVLTLAADSVNANGMSPVKTIDGLWIGSVNESAKHRFIDDAGKVTDPAVSMGSLQYVFSLTSLPAFQKAPTNEVEVGDFINAPADLPKQISNFLEKQVTANCKPGEYSRIWFEKNDGVNQISLHEAGCQRDAAYYFVYKNGEYKEVFATQEGIDCSERDKLGISKVLVPDGDCRLPGQGL